MISFSLKPQFGFDISYNSYIDGGFFVFNFIFPKIYIHNLPSLNRKDLTYGISYHGRCIFLNWGKKLKAIYMPWFLTLVRYQVKNKNGNWNDYIFHTEGDDGRYKETYNYKYTLKSGEIQKRLATIYECKMEWRWRLLKRMPFPRLVKKYINIDFDDEVGEGTGSWKGGVVGCGYEILPGESMYCALKRMERERKF